MEPARTEHEAGRAPRIAVVGISLGPTCGVRDHAAQLAEALDRETAVCSWHWLSRDAASPRAAHAQITAFARELTAQLQREPPDAVLLHYSVFAYSYRGVPLFAPSVLSALCRARIPLVTVLHEFAYPWTRRGWRGKLLALTQRAALLQVVRASAALMLTADFRAEWVASRPWLPSRRLAVVPVFSNLPAANVDLAADGPVMDSLAVDAPAVDGPAADSPAIDGPATDRPGPVVGLFGYSAEGTALGVTLDAMRLLQDRGAPVRLSLLGAPGPRSAAGERWRAQARARDLADALAFSGILPPQQLADALAMCDVLLFAETAGPTSRKTTLAASLASGRPVIALDGPRRWEELAQASAVQIVSPTASGLAGAVQAALADGDLRAALGARGRAFARERMSATRSARALGALLGDVLAQPGASPRGAQPARVPPRGASPGDVPPARVPPGGASPGDVPPGRVPPEDASPRSAIHVERAVR